MAFEPQTIKIGEFRYDVTPFHAKKATKVLAELAKLLGRTIGSFADGGVRAIDVIGDALANIDPDKIQWVLDQLAETTTVTGPDGAGYALEKIYDKHFAGERLADLLEWAKFALEVNYTRFFEEIAKRNLLPAKTPAVASSVSPTG